MGKVPFHVSVAACAAAMLPSVGHAATDADVEALRAELARVKAEYAERIGRSSRRRSPSCSPRPTSARPQRSTRPSPPPPARRVRRPAGASGRPRSASAFNPAISLILAGNYANLSQDPDDYAIQGFMPAGDEIGPGERSFNLGESELTIAASVDPYFMGSLTAAITRRERDRGRGGVLPHDSRCRRASRSRAASSSRASAT